MQHEFVRFKKRSVEEMDALRPKNSKLKKKLETEMVNTRGKDKETPMISGFPHISTRSVKLKNKACITPLPE